MYSPLDIGCWTLNKHYYYYNLPKYQMVYWHHFNETEEMARELEAAFPNVVFGVAPAILKEQLHDQLEKFIRSTSPERLMTESDVPMVGERRATNHRWEAGTVLKTVETIKGVTLPIIRNICENSFRRLFGPKSSSSLAGGGGGNALVSLYLYVLWRVE